MTAISLPTDPAPRSVIPRLLDFGADLIPPLGGAVQRISRLGSRYRIEVEMPPMHHEPDGRRWVAKLRQAKVNRAVLKFPQPSFTPGPLGDPLVKTAVAGGTSVEIKGLLANYIVREGQFFSIIHGTRRYLHSAAAQAVANSAGDVTVTVDPMLRVAISVDDVIEMAVPKIEGYLEGDELAWTISLEHFTGLSFSITEAE